MKRYWAAIVTLGLVSVSGAPASAFYSVSPGQTPEQVMELFKTNIVRDDSTKTFYVRWLGSFCTLRQTDFEISTSPAQIIPETSSSVQNLEGSCVTSPTSPLVDPRLFPPGAAPRLVRPVRATLRTVYHGASRSERLGYSERLFEMVVSDAPDAVRMCAVSIHTQTPTGRHLFIEQDFSSALAQPCNFDTIIAPMVQ